MCFRPSIVEKPFECPECGKRLNPVLGQLPKVCPFCDSDIHEAAEAAASASADVAPVSAFVKPNIGMNAPVAPAAPAPPGPAKPTVPVAPAISKPSDVSTTPE